LFGKLHVKALRKHAEIALAGLSNCPPKIGPVVPHNGQVLSEFRIRDEDPSDQVSHLAQSVFFRRGLPGVQLPTPRWLAEGVKEVKQGQLGLILNLPHEGQSLDVILRWGRRRRCPRPEEIIQDLFGWPVKEPEERLLFQIGCWNEGRITRP
jgi:hypothetical protein